MAVDRERLERIAQGAVDGVAKLIDFTEALPLLKRTADGDPCQLSRDQAGAVLWMLQAVAEERKAEREDLLG